MILRTFWRSLGAALFLLVLSAAPATSAAERPNIIVMMADDIGFSDLGCYGGEIQTPRLDQLAGNGLRFTQFYNTARCCPTRASLLTGLYPHQAGLGHMTDGAYSPLKAPGYTRDLNNNCRTIAEVLREAGYATYMAGKWHVTTHIAPEGPKHNWPLQRGFDKFYGTITGAGSFYDPSKLCRGNTFITPENDPEYQVESFYYTDAIVDNAITFLKQHEQGDDRPFFLYVAFTCPHWPMHALPEDIAKYEGQYDDGYGPIRKARYQRLKELGLIDPSWEMAPQVGNWKNIKPKEWEIRCMEVYAAMIDRMDQNIGKLVDHLQASKQGDNTLVFYLQDNGGCAEGIGRQKQNRLPERRQAMDADELQESARPQFTRDGRPVRTGPDAMPGPEDTYVAYGRNWANVSNTPFREYKHWVHEGGISTPLIVHWPQGIAPEKRGQLVSTPGHLIDIMATCVDVAHASYPSEVEGHQIVPLEGVSLAPAFQGQAIERTTPIFWEHEANGAVRDGKWKIVRYGNQRTGKTKPWELYDMEADRTEQHDLASQHPQRVEKMAQQWDEWAHRAHVLPWPWGETN